MNEPSLRERIADDLWCSSRHLSQIASRILWFCRQLEGIAGTWWAREHHRRRARTKKPS